jgi:hypothetical protein
MLPLLIPTHALVHNLLTTATSMVPTLTPGWCPPAQAEFYSWAAFGKGLPAELRGYGPPSVGGRKATLSPAAQAYAEEIALVGLPFPLAPCMLQLTHAVHGRAFALLPTVGVQHYTIHLERTVARCINVNSPHPNVPTCATQSSPAPIHPAAI